MRNHHSCQDKSLESSRFNILNPQTYKKDYFLNFLLFIYSLCVHSLGHFSPLPPSPTLAPLPTCFQVDAWESSVVHLGKYALNSIYRDFDQVGLVSGPHNILKTLVWSDAGTENHILRNSDLKPTVTHCVWKQAIT
jgi:hypothetical protein